jgi:hypothetical protein
MRYGYDNISNTGMFNSECTKWRRRPDKNRTFPETKLMDDCLIRIPKQHMNTESVAKSCCFMILMVLNHRLMQISSARDNHLPIPWVRSSLGQREEIAAGRLIH